MAAATRMLAVFQRSSSSRSFGFSSLARANHPDSIPDHVSELLDEFTKKPQTSASLQMLMKTGRGDYLGKSYHRDTDDGSTRLATEAILIQVGSFVLNELPIRLAHRIRDLDQVPMMRDMPSVKKVKSVYIDSFQELVFHPKITNAQTEEDFARALEHLYTKHSSVLVTMAQGAYELRDAIRQGKILGHEDAETGLEFERMNQCHEFLDRFYTSRIGIRVLAGQYLHLRGQPMDDYVGMICLKTSPSEVIRKAVENATMMCRRQYGRAPRVDIIGRLDLTFPYIPTYLHYIALELLKNALRATAEKHAGKPKLPAVTVVIADGNDHEDVCIKVMDEGGGIRRSQIEKIWSYLFTTADPSIQKGYLVDDQGSQDHGANSPIAGLGYGLPISRSYCRYFGGDLDLMSMEGYGTDAFIYLNRLGDSKEPLPI